MGEPTQPLLIFDGKCSFCRIWVDYWKLLAGDAVEFAPSQEVQDNFPQIPRENLGKAVHFVDESGEISAGAEAVFRSLSYHSSYRWTLWMYRHVPGFAPVTEAAYRWIAAHRDFGYSVTVTLFGRKVTPLRYDAVTWLFRKLLAIIWIIAFISFGVQAQALIGSNGVLPLSMYLNRSVPTLFLFNASDGAITAVWVTGVVCGLLALFGIFTRLAFFGAFALYLSLLNASQEFLSYQWDILLLEAGFLAIFLGYSRTIVWLYRWLLFRLMLLSGLVKLLSGDETWRSLTALLVHFETQPIPTPLAWYVHQAPPWFLKLACGLVFVVELLAPFLIFFPRRARIFGAWLLIGLQLLILTTGNYAFFNWLSLALCLFLFDDQTFPNIQKAERFFLPEGMRKAIAWSMTVLIGVVSASLFRHAITGRLLPLTSQIVSFVAPFNISSSYGLFASMTTQRPEIIIEGSNDGVNWRAYEFRYKPGDPGRRPPWAAPHQPRLDWQMWFAALGSYRENTWLLNLIIRLLQGLPEVLRQVEYNPFPDNPPTWIRADLYLYRFTRGRSRDWWTRTPAGQYLPPVSLEVLSELPLLKGDQR